MTHEVDTQWIGHMQFNAVINGHTIVMDAPERAGGKDAGPIPKPFVLSALSGCTGMDVAAILRKADASVSSFHIKVEGKISRRPPIEYIAIHVVYEFEGPEQHQPIAVQAVHDSQEKYCGVSSMLRKALPVTWEIFYNGACMFNNRTADADTGDA